MLHLIIDADPIVYRAGFASESHHYHVVAETKEGEIVEAYFQPKEMKNGKWKTAGEQMRKWCADKEVLDKERVVVAEPKEHALHIVAQELTNIKHAVKRKFNLHDDDLYVSVILTGPGNFREKIATLAPYKGNRDTTHKPYWYQAIRNYLTDMHDARVVSGREADDEVSILGWQHYSEGTPYVVSTIDKDLDQIPGWHYDYRQKVFYDVSPFNADKAFWTQCLSGDQTDNIPGCYKIGSIRAEKIVDEVIQAAADNIWPMPSEFWDRIVKEYETSQTRKDCPYECRATEDVAIETARLVYMQRKPRELWCPPGEPPQYTGEGDE